MRGIETGRCLCSSRRGSGSSRRMVLKAANHVERVRLGQGNTFCIVGTTWQTGIASPVNACMGLTCQVPTALHHDMAHAPPHLLHPLQSYKMLAPPSVGQVLWQGGMPPCCGPTPTPPPPRTPTWSKWWRWPPAAFAPRPEWEAASAACPTGRGAYRATLACTSPHCPVSTAVCSRRTAPV